MDMIATTEKLRVKLEADRGEWRRVSEESGVPYTTIKNFMQRPDSFPHVTTLDRLCQHYWPKKKQLA